MPRKQVFRGKPRLQLRFGTGLARQRRRKWSHRVPRTRRKREPFMAHLLVIDDDPVLVPEQVRRAFPSPSHRVDVVTTGAGGLDVVATHPPDVILLDLRLP